MGRWAQAVRKGQSAGRRGTLGPPPAPGLAVDDGRIVQTSNGAANPGGSCTLEFKETEEGGWEFYDVLGWTPVADWGASATYAGLWLRAFETGNGTAYAGQGAYSYEIGPI